MTIKERFLSAINREKKITSGNIPKNVFALAMPLMIGAVLQTSQSLIDLFWVGKLGTEAISAVAMSGTIIMFVFTISLGLSIGTLSLVARDIGAGRKDEANVTASHSVIVGLALGVAAALTGLLFSDIFLRLLGADTDVIAAGNHYLRIMLMGSFTMIVLFTCNYVLQAAGDTFHPMLFLGLANIFNIVLDPIFIFGIGVPKMGTSGAALATVLGQAISMVLVLNLLLRKDALVKLTYRGFRFRPDILKDIVKIGVPASLQMFLRTTMYIVLVSLVAGFGMKAVAAYGIIMRLQVVMLMPSFALGGAAATFMGQNVGACKPGRARTSVWTATFFDSAIMLFLGVVFFIFPRAILSVFNQDVRLLDIGVEFLRISAFFYSFMGFGIVLNRGLRGAGDTFMPMLITAFTLWAYTVPLAFYLSQNTVLGLKGIWWAMATSHLVQAILTIIWFESGMWKRSMLRVCHEGAPHF